MDGWLALLLLFVTGAVAGTVNVIAGGGSFLTLPVLIFLGLPAGVANGTNRIGIVLQNVAAVGSFRRHRVLDLQWAGRAIPAAVVGALLGTWIALRTGDDAFRRILAVLMIAVTLWSLWSPRGGWLPEASERQRGLLVAGGFFLAGVYGGFVQAGVGFLILAVTSAVGLDLVRGNAVKVLCILCFSAVSLALFAWNGRVDWPLGLALAAGTVSGGLLGARLTVLKGHAWLRAAVTATILLFALRLLLWG